MAGSCGFAKTKKFLVNRVTKLLKKDFLNGIGYLVA